MPHRRTDKPHSAVADQRPCRSTLKPGERALVRLTLAGLGVADTYCKGRTLERAAALIELSRAATAYREVLAAR